MNARVIISLFLSMIVFCGVSANEQMSVEEKKYDEIFLPDSLLTNEQVELKYKIGELILHNVKVKNGLMVVTLEEKDFNNKGIPSYYYRMLVKNIEEANCAIKDDRTPKKEVKKSLDEAKKDFKNELEKREKSNVSN